MEEYVKTQVKECKPSTHLLKKLILKWFAETGPSFPSLNRDKKYCKSNQSFGQINYKHFKRQLT